jgi:GntR family transcriptional regulator
MATDVIEFRLERRSGVAPYLQIERQVRHAIRLGYLRPGDRLPTAKEVVRQLVINPNTVLKAYHDLEHEGLVQGRPGLGTFVVGQLAGPSAPDLAALRRRLGRWMDSARAAGLTDDDVEALIDTARRESTRSEVA